MFTLADHAHMTRALALAQHGLYTTTPNPRVGCVLVKDERIIGEGWHVRVGAAHAEVEALQQATRKHQPTAGATAYITLEPCQYHGRTPPCTQALIDAKITRVIVAMMDPNPLVAGQGLATLRAAGIEVRCGLLRDEAHELNIGFSKRMQTGLPWVRLKVASSLDGQIALANGQSQWITELSARDDGHAWRARACAILTGSGTVRADNPLLNVRAVTTSRQPPRFVLDSHLTLTPTAKIFQHGETILITTERACAAQPEVFATWREQNIEVWLLPADAHGQVALPALLERLGQAQINELHVEAGSHLNGRLLNTGLVDELLLYLAPKLIGMGKPAFNLTGLTDLTIAPSFKLHTMQLFGSDLRLQYRKLITA